VSRRTGRSPAFIATLVTVPVVVTAAIVIAVILRDRTPTDTPLTLPPTTGPAVAGPECRALIAALPSTLAGLPSADLAARVPTATKAWRATTGGTPILLRCGIARPPEFNIASALQVVDGVQWLETSAADAPTTIWYAVDRSVYVQLTVQANAGPTPIQDISDTVSRTLPARPIDPGPLPN